MRRFAAVAVPVILALGVVLQALFAFASFPFRAFAEAMMLLAVFGLAGFACIGIFHWFSRRPSA